MGVGVALKGKGVYTLPKPSKNRGTGDEISENEKIEGQVRENWLFRDRQEKWSEMFHSRSCLFTLVFAKNFRLSI